MLIQVIQIFDFSSTKKKSLIHFKTIVITILQ